MSDPEKKKDEQKPTEHPPQGNNLAIGMCLGCGIGGLLGVAMDNIAIGMCLGISIGMMLGLCIRR